MPQPLGPAWSSAETSLSISLRTPVLCPIFGSNFAPPDAPGLVDRVVGADHRIRVLDVTGVLEYRPGEDPEDFQFLFEQEASKTERVLLRVEPVRACHDFIRRVTRWVRLQNVAVHPHPDPERFEVQVFARTPRSIRLNDHGILVPKRGSTDVLASIDKVRRSLSEVLGRFSV